jgi:hypothetical protein
MNKRTEVVVKLRWIEDAIVCHPKGGCEFHLREDGSGKFCPGCGCCQLAKAYLDAKQKTRRKA